MKKILLTITSLAILTICFYSPSLKYPFLFDDTTNISENPAIKTFKPKEVFFRDARWMASFINQWTYHNWKLNTVAYRSISILIHVLIGILIFFSILTFLNSFNLALITSGLFLLHPTQTQTVSFITQMRLEGLATFFVFLTILLFTFASKSKNSLLKYILYAITYLSLFFSVGTKEIIIALPLLLVLVEWFFISSGSIKNFIKRIPIHIFFTLSFLTFFFWIKSPKTQNLIPIPKTQHAKAATQFVKDNFANKLSSRGNSVTEKSGQIITPLTYLNSQFKVVTHYITMYFWPFNISFDYGWKIPTTFWSKKVIPYLFFLILILVIALFLFIKKPTNITSFSIAWFFISIAPRSTIIPSPEIICDYKAYLASFGVMLFIGYVILEFVYYLQNYLKTVRPEQMKCVEGSSRRDGGFNPLSEQPFDAPSTSSELLSANGVQTILPIYILLILFGLSAQNRNKVWGNNIIFWADVIKKTEPETPARAYNNYATEIAYAGQIDEAIKYYEKSIEKDNAYASPYTNIALLTQKKGNFKKALEYYTLALQHGSSFPPELFNNLGSLHMQTKNYFAAKKCFAHALKLSGNKSKALANMGTVSIRENNLNEALKFYQEAFKQDPHSLHILYVYGTLLYTFKKYKEALPVFERVQAISKSYKNSESMLSNCRKLI